MGMKEYYFYIDESGQFEGEQSYIGGILCEAPLAKEEIADEIIQEIRAPYLEQMEELSQEQDFHGRKIDDSFHHATQLPPSIKAEVKLSMLEAIHKRGYRFVVFEPEADFMILNSTETYIVALADGIKHLLQELSKEAFETQVPFHLNLVIGKRKDTGGKNKNRKNGKAYFIEDQEIRDEIYHLTGLARAVYPERFDRNSSLRTIRMEDDKKCALLVLADYVVNSWRTQDSFEKTDELSYRFEALNPLFECLPMRGETIYDAVKKAVDAHDFTEAMLLAMNASEGAYHRNQFLKLLKDALLRLPKIELRAEMDRYLRKFESIISMQRDCRHAIELLQRTYEIVAHRKILGDYVIEFQANLLLWKMGACTHIGDLRGFREAADACDGLVRQARDIDLYLIYVTYQVGFLRSQLDYEGSYVAGKEAVDILRMLRAPAKAVEQKAGRSFLLYRDRYTKLCGALVSTCILLADVQPGLYDDAKFLSNQAMHSFRLKEDKERQQQLRAELELAFGHKEEAVAYLEKALHIELDHLDETRCQSFSPFEWYHFSRILSRLLLAGEPYRAMAEAAFWTALPAWEKYQASLPLLEFPNTASFAQISICLAETGKLDRGIELARKAYLASYNEWEPEGNKRQVREAPMPVVFVIGLMQQAVYLALKAKKAPLKAEDFEDIRYHVMRYEDDWPLEGLPSMMKSFDAELDRISESKDASWQQEALLRISRMADF